MNREAQVRFCESAGLRCPAPLTYVEGRLQTREFESKNGGGKRQRAEIVAQRVQFLGPRPDAPMGGEADEPMATEEVPF